GEERLAGSFGYKTDLFAAATVGRLIGHFETLLGGVVATPEAPISTLPLLTREERERLLVTWNDTRRELGEDQRLHELFEDQAARTPDSVALVFGESALTYAELNARANRLAHHLRDQGTR